LYADFCLHKSAKNANFSLTEGREKPAPDHVRKGNKKGPIQFAPVIDPGRKVHVSQRTFQGRGLHEHPHSVNSGAGAGLGNRLGLLS